MEKRGCPKDSPTLFWNAPDHPFRDGAGDWLGGPVPFDVLLSGEIRTVEDLLQAEYLNALLLRLFDEGQVFLDHCFLDLQQGAFMAGI
jgi:hypothetical protein